jgi:hypothetical protein
MGRKERREKAQEEQQEQQQAEDQHLEEEQLLSNVVRWQRGKADKVVHAGPSLKLLASSLQDQLSSGTKKKLSKQASKRVTNSSATFTPPSSTFSRHAYGSASELPELAAPGFRSKKASEADLQARAAEVDLEEGVPAIEEDPAFVSAAQKIVPQEPVRKTMSYRVWRVSGAHASQQGFVQSKLLKPELCLHGHLPWQMIMYILVVGPWKFIRGLGWLLNK